MRRIFGRGRYANVTATMALIVALSGTSYAAIKLPANSVGSKQIKKSAVANSDLRSNAVTSGKVKNGSLLSADFKAGQLPAGPAGAAGPRGFTGAKGDKGDKGDTGAPGSAKAYATVDNGGPTLVTAKGFTAVAQPDGTTGVYCLTPAAGISVVNSAPIASVEWGASSGSDLLVHPLGGGVADCPEGTLEVRTYELDAGSFVASDDAAFSVLLP